MDGWVKLHKKIRDHWIWQNSDYLKWWLDLIMLANYQSNKILINGKLKYIEIGMLHTSETKLAQRWFISRMTVSRFLDLLEKDQMITVNKNRQDGTTVKILNYQAYQVFFKDEMCNGIDNGVSNDSATNVHIKDIKDIKPSLSSEQSPDGERVADANKKPKSGGRKKMVYSHDNPYYKSAAWLAKKIESNFPEYKKHEEKDIQIWADSARLMFEKDGRNRETANILLRFSQNDDFWKKNIRSMPTFREQYDQLLAKCPEAQKNKASPDPWANVITLEEVNNNESI